MGKCQIVINRLKANSKKETAYYASEMMSNSYSEEEGWGYTDVLRVDDTITATLQKRISTYYSVWNEELQQIEKQCFQIVSEVRFEMDFSHGLLIAEGTNTQLNRIKQSFRQIFWNEFVYEELPLMPVDYIKMFSETRVLSSIVEISINDFQYEGCLIGRFTAKPTSQLDILTKVGENAKNIIRAKLKISFGGEESLLTVGNRNVLVFDSSDDVKDVFVSFLKVNIR